MLNVDLWRGDRNMQRSLVDDMFGMLNDWDRSFFAPIRYRTSTTEQTMAPACDVTESEDGYVLSFDVPGLKKEDINIEVTGRQVTISGERKREEQQQNGNTHRIERVYGKFQRTFELPEGINTEVIDASYENGVLKVAVPKAETSKPRKVQITEGGKGFLKRLTSKQEAKAVNA